MKYVMILLIGSWLYAKEHSMKPLLTHLLQPNITTALAQTQQLKQSVIQNKDMTVLQTQFKPLVLTWKRVQALYLAGDFHEDVIDTPRYIDTFYDLRENLSKQLDRIIHGKQPVSDMMFKHSFKTINALEYLLFSDYTHRSKQMVQIVLDNLMDRFQAISQAYTNHHQRFLTDDRWANGLILNTLINESFRLRDHRVGNPAGLSRKQRGKPNNKKAEYVRSDLSKDAIEMILHTHQQLFDSPFYDFGDRLIHNGFQKEVTLIQEAIKNAQMQLKHLKNNDFTQPNVKHLYQALDHLHKTYYLSLVNALEIDANIVDADGD